MGVRIPALSGLISRAVVAVVAVASSFPFRLASPRISFRLGELDLAGRMRGGKGGEGGTDAEDYTFLFKGERELGSVSSYYVSLSLESESDPSHTRDSPIYQ